MSSEFAILIILLILAIFYFRRRQSARVAALTASEAPRTQADSAYELPSGYCFHPGHTWMKEQRRETARVGIDRFASNLLGKVDRIAVTGEQRWVRQGQKLITLTGECELVEMVSPVEGVITAINQEVIKDPELLSRDPYGQGWVCAIKSPEMATNRRNLVQGENTTSWMGHSLRRLKAMLAQADPAPAQDGDLPGRGVLARLSPELRKRVVNEFFVT